MFIAGHETTANALAWALFLLSQDPAADARLVVPMRKDFRSINVAVACAMAVGEALRQAGGFPG